jgi:hypothetical protein
MSVSELLQRLQALPFGVPWDWRQIRKDIHDEHDRATTTADRVALLAIYKSAMDAVERNADFTPEDMERFKKARRQDYNLLLIREAMIGKTDGNINPQKIGEITRREVESGRMAPDDDFHKLAVAGATILTPWPRQEQKQHSILARLGNVLYWLGCGLAFAVLALGGIMANADKEGVYIVTTAMVAAVLVWLVGRACRYVLSGS